MEQSMYEFKETSELCISGFKLPGCHIATVSAENMIFTYVFHVFTYGGMSQNYFLKKKHARYTELYLY